MHEEFAVFLASQKIDASKWEEIKETNPEMVQEEIDLFSDLVWDKVLSNTTYLTNYASDSINFFRCNAESISRLVVKADKKDFDFMKKNDFDWFIHNSTNKAFTYFKGEKAYFKEKNLEKFELIEKGCIVDKGELFESIYKIIG
jgi:hypothetical protein